MKKNSFKIWWAQLRISVQSGLLCEKKGILCSFEKALCLALVFTMLVSFSGFAAACEDIPGRLLRLHVLANSDSTEDQTLKLQVRDRILQESADLLEHANTRAEAEKILQQSLAYMQTAAQDEVRRRGYSYPVTVKLTNMYFITREYRTTTLPAGKYEALRVCIGSAKGHNWWCVIFPPMCLPAAEEPQELKDVLNNNQLQIVEGKNRYQIKFKTWEAYERLQNWLKENKE